MPIYLDNAATSYPKPEVVYRAVDQALRHAGGNPGRGGHDLSLAAGRAVLDARDAVAGLFKIPDSSRVVFTSGATEALNLALFGLLRPGERVVTTSMEHNAVTRPLRALQDAGVEVVKVPADRQGLVDPETLKRACAKPTRMLVMSHCSNVTGTLQPIEAIGPWCREQGILFLLDAAQSAGIFPIDVVSQGIDLLAAPGHKGLLGPTGTGFLYVREGLQPKPLIYGGTGSNSSSDRQPEAFPERLESGTLNTPGLAGLQAGIDYLQELGLETIRRHEQQLLQQLLEGFRQIPGIVLYGPGRVAGHGGAVSFRLEQRDPSETGFLLDREFDICCRVGLHCSPDAHKTIGSYPDGTIRVSPGYFSSHGDIERLLLAVAVLATRSN
jgi:cysteine desulfurase / selenocysteine lyase